jgi:16S rRNA (cytosine1402-N4)-methyltransferase
MRDEIVEAFRDVPAGVVLDATLGAGGHAEAILESRDDLRVLGVDRDPSGPSRRRAPAARFGDRAMTHRCRFDRLDDAMEALRCDALSGALFDLGVSSPQLDRAERGFSYRTRVRSTCGWTPRAVVGRRRGERLRGGRSRPRHPAVRRRAVRQADRRAIVAARPIETTTRLAEVVTTAIPAAARRTGGHPAKRTFQAIRIEVNGELDALPEAIDEAIDALVPGGRLAVLAYHSGEDRIVKDRIRAAQTGGASARPSCPACAAPCRPFARAGAEARIGRRAGGQPARVVRPSARRREAPAGEVRR